MRLSSLKRGLAVGLAAMFIAAVITGCGLRDPRRHCTHPEHADYVKEKRMKRQGF